MQRSPLPVLLRLPPQYPRVVNNVDISQSQDSVYSVHVCCNDSFITHRASRSPCAPSMKMKSGLQISGS